MQIENSLGNSYEEGPKVQLDIQNGHFKSQVTLVGHNSGHAFSRVCWEKT